MSYRVAITYTQESSDKTDHRTLSEDFSDDGVIHEIKCKVWTEELAEALKRISNRLIDMSIEAQQSAKTPPGQVNKP